MKRLPISAAILVKNAERCLYDVLTALSCVDEIVLLDNGSTDQTLDIAAKFDNVIIHHHEFDGFGAMKNRVASLAKHDWILSIDSDEIITPELAHAIATADLSQNHYIYQINRINHYRRRPIMACGWSPDIIARLYNRTFTQFSDRAVHEAIIIPQNAQLHTLNGALNHYSFDDASALIAKMQQYSSLFAEQFAHTKRVGASDAFWHGLAAFIKNYLIKCGFQYGADGLTIAASQAGGAFYKYAKLRERNQQLDVSLIITTYNRPDALQKVLVSALQQNVLPREILVADDGSRPDTAEAIAQLTAQSPIPIRHIWQEDDGFRLTQSRNRALAAAQGEYIVMIDGDMVLHPDFIADHIAAAQKRCIIQGSRVLLTADKTEDLLIEPRLYEPLAWWHRGIKKRLSAWRCEDLSRWIWRKKSRHYKSIKGCNMGFFLEDALAVNGFNNDFVGWGREDSEFVARLYHSGCYRRNLKFGGIAYHLWHHEAERDALPQNDALLNRTLTEGLTWCENGVNVFLEKK